MKKNKLFILLLIFIIGCSANADESNIIPTRIFIDDTIESFDIDGDNIAIIGGEEQHDWAVYLYNIQTKELKQITHDNSRKRSVKIENNVIYWIDARTNPRYIWTYDLDERVEKNTYVFDGKYNKSKYSKDVVYSSNINGLLNYDLFLNGEQITFKQDAQELMPYIHKSKIGYLESKKKSRLVHLYDIETKKDIIISDKAPSEWMQYGIKIYDNHIVWQTCENSNCDNEELYVV